MVQCFIVSTKVVQKVLQTNMLVPKTPTSRVSILGNQKPLNLIGLSNVSVGKRYYIYIYPLNYLFINF